MQIISGIGIPVDLELESVTIGYVFKAEFFLPENASNYLNGLADPFDVTTRPITGRRRRRFINESKSSKASDNALDDYQGFDSEQNERFEKHIVDAEIVESGTEQTTHDLDDYSDERSWFEPEHFDRSKDPTAVKAPQNLGTTRWTIYKGLAKIAER